MSKERHPIVSIVVPVYKTERYLVECVESIRAQTLDDIEIVLVDDGSPDKCGDIADGYAALDSRIKVVHRTNGGIGPARNSGMEVATGKYIGFVDSDDWIEPEMYEELLQYAETSDADVAIGGSKRMTNGSVAEEGSHPYAGRTFQGDEELFELRKVFYGAPTGRGKGDACPVSVCIAVFRRSLLEENEIVFPSIRGEDVLFNIAVCRAANRIVCTDGTGYCCRRDGQPSVTNSAFEYETMISFFEFFDNLELEAKKELGIHRQESLHRASWQIINYTRDLILQIESSPENSGDKDKYVLAALSNPALRRACEEHSFWDFSLRQAFFFLATKKECVRAVRLMAKIKALWFC